MNDRGNEPLLKALKDSAESRWWLQCRSCERRFDATGGPNDPGLRPVPEECPHCGDDWTRRPPDEGGSSPFPAALSPLPEENKP